MWNKLRSTGANTLFYFLNVASFVKWNDNNPSTPRNFLLIKHHSKSSIQCNLRPFFDFLNYMLFSCFAQSLTITEKFHFHANLYLIRCPFFIFITRSFHKLPFLVAQPEPSLSKLRINVIQGRERDVLRGNIAGDIIKWNVFSRFLCLLHFGWFMKLEFKHYIQRGHVLLSNVI